MDNHVFAAVLLSDILHAGWNSILTIDPDRISTVLLLALVQAFIANLILPFVELPYPAAWPWIVGGALLHTGYKILLIQA